MKENPKLTKIVLQREGEKDDIWLNTYINKEECDKIRSRLILGIYFFTGEFGNGLPTIEFSITKLVEMHSYLPFCEEEILIMDKNGACIC